MTELLHCHPRIKASGAQNSQTLPAMPTSLFELISSAQSPITLQDVENLTEFEHSITTPAEKLSTYALPDEQFSPQDDRKVYFQGPRFLPQSTPSLAPPQSPLESTRPWPNSEIYSSIGVQSLYSEISLPDFKYPVLSCKHCEKVFTGKYGIGNRRRHVIQSHKLVSNHACRVCKKTYHRADALRRHGWEKHRLEEFRPYSRRRD